MSQIAEKHCNVKEYLLANEHNWTIWTWMLRSCYQFQPRVTLISGNTSPNPIRWRTSKVAVTCQRWITVPTMASVMLRVRWPGTHCQTASETRLCQPVLSEAIWRLFFSPSTSAPAIRGFAFMRYINLRLIDWLIDHQNHKMMSSSFTLKQCLL